MCMEKRETDKIEVLKRNHKLSGRPNERNIEQKTNQTPGFFEIEET